MFATDALYSVQLKVKFLAGSELGNENIVQSRLKGLLGEDLGLGTLRDPFDGG